MKFLFDLGGVFFDWDPKYFFENIFSDSANLEYFLSTVCNDFIDMHKRSFKSIITGSAPAQSMALIVAIIVILGTATRLPSVNPAASNDK